MTENPPEVEDNEAQELAALLAGLVRAEDAAFAMTDQQPPATPNVAPA